MMIASKNATSKSLPYLVCVNGVQFTNSPVHFRYRHSWPITGDCDPVTFYHCQVTVTYADFRQILVGNRQEVMVRKTTKGIYAFNINMYKLI